MVPTADIIKPILNPLLAPPKTLLSDCEKIRAAAIAWAHIDQIVYINLDSRVDRRKELLSEFNRLLIPESKIRRFAAIAAEPGCIGCSSSHLAAIKMARQEKWKNVLILEDDFNFITDDTRVWSALNQFFQTYAQKFTVAQLTAHSLGQCIPCDDIVQFGRNTSNAAGYLVSATFYEHLIRRWDHGLEQLMITKQDWIWINDQSWKQLQVGKFCSGLGIYYDIVMIFFRKLVRVFAPSRLSATVF